MNELNKTANIDVLEMWRDGKYYEVGKVINSEAWTSSEVAHFAFYMMKYEGTKQLETLYKFL